MEKNLLILIAPPASGKTHWIESFADNLGADQVMVVVPLRALADECKEKWGEEIKVVTPEEWMSHKISKEVIIFDEFHLNFYWGDTFRPLLWEAFYELTLDAKLCVFLTATLADFMLEEIKLFNCHFNQILMCDHGNRTLKYRPVRYIKLPSKSWMEKTIELGPRGNGANLIFCAYREEVREWGKKLEARGYTVWTCVGGEAGQMKAKMEGSEIPQFIIATSVLSHGVNLPSISCIFFLYPLKNIDFWIQMVARGGRKGESYEVFALENPCGIKRSRLSNVLAILALGFKMRLHSLRQEIDQWFLKESS